ncbi:MAG TPA: M23 family metallopeptidase [Thermoanaerobaculia bacterium]|nr:M23 family metallopeptidase [Thermoanaerobaculia bacterium]
MSDGRPLGSRGAWRRFLERAAHLLGSLVLEGPLVFALVLGAWIMAERSGWAPAATDLANRHDPRKPTFAGAVSEDAVSEDDRADGAIREAPGPVEPGDLAALQAKRLAMPVDGITREDLFDHFDDPRNGRRHEAIDIMAPRGTPVRAVEDGVIAKLFESRLGGLTIYQFDPESRFAYYYAHLDRYAPSLSDGDAVGRGEVIGYVGTTGNVPDEAPHLHFAIYRLGPDQRWWEGEALNPYEVLSAP